MRCNETEFGELKDVVIDPTRRRVTHLVVQPAHHSGGARLIPIEFAEPRGDAEIALRCTVEDAAKFEKVEEFVYVRISEAPVEDPAWDVGVENVLAMPFDSGIGADSEPFMATDYSDKVGVTYDRVPKGEVEIRRASAVTSSDGEFVGHVEAFLVDAEQRITHLVLERGHLWRKRDASIPIGSVSEVTTDNVTVGLTVAEIGELPAVRVNRWFGS